MRLIIDCLWVTNDSISKEAGILEVCRSSVEINKRIILQLMLNLKVRTLLFVRDLQNFKSQDVLFLTTVRALFGSQNDKC